MDWDERGGRVSRCSACHYSGLDSQRERHPSEEDRESLEVQTNSPNWRSGLPVGRAQWNKSVIPSKEYSRRMEIKEGYGCEEI